MMERFVVTTWIVWNRRNKTHLNQSVQPLAQVLDEANHYLLEYRKFNACPMKTKPPRMVKWKPPDCNCYKTNFNGAIFEDSGEVRIGVVIRNSRGKVVASLS